MKDMNRFVQLVTILFLGCSATLNAQSLVNGFNTGLEWTMTGQQSSHSLVSQKVNAAVATTQLGPTDIYGSLHAPDGSTWVYTAAFGQKYGSFTDMEVTIYDSDNNLVGKIVDTLVMDDPDVTGINYVEMTSFVTKKFFNFDNDYEVMLFMHATTSKETNYEGRYFNRVYTIASGTTTTDPACEVQGRMVISENVSDYNENYTVVFARDSAKTTDAYTMCYDVYTKASYASPKSPTLKKTFRVPYANISAGESDMLPIFMIPVDGQLHYVLAQYEKPYFVSGTPIDQDPIVSDNNNLVINYLNHHFDTLYTTKIAVKQDSNEKLLYTFPKLGNLGYNDDIILNYDGGTAPAYVITLEQFNLESDGSILSFYLYDVEGNKIATIAEKTIGRMQLSPVAGQETQWLFLKDEDEGKYQFVDVPSCKKVLETSIYLEDGSVMSQNIDRVPNGSSYQYVVALLQGDVEKNGTISQRIAWLNRDGKLHHYDKINLGEDVEAANVNIYAPDLNPWIFDTDDAREYMVLVKRAGQGTALLVCNTEGEILLDYGSDPAKGGDISMVYLYNNLDDPKLMCVYVNNDGLFTMNYTPLPLNDVQIAGAGSMEDPYQITCMSDLLYMEQAPDSCYRVMNDIDGMSVPFKGIDVTFKGVLDGNNHVLRNLYLDGSGLFVRGEHDVVIKDLVLENPVQVLPSVSTPAGVVVNTMQGDMSGEDGSMEMETVAASLHNIQLINPVVVGDEYHGVFGGVVGNASLYVGVTACSLKEAEIILPKAEYIGGVVGQLATSSSLGACAFSGIIDGGDAVGGLVGTAGGGEQIVNGHVDAMLQGKKVIGGVIAESQRAPISQCYVQGEIHLSADAEIGHVGGVAGYLELDEVGEGPIVISHCVVALDTISLPAIDSLCAHRVIGWSSGDKYNYFDQKMEKPETKLAYCYVVEGLSAIDANIALKDTTTEGANVSIDVLTEDWLKEQGFAFGEQVSEPWLLDADGLRLWYEDELSVEDAVDNIVIGDGLTFEDTMLMANGDVHVYTLNGILVLQGRDKVDTTILKQGVYIVTVTNNAHRAAVKVLIP